MRSNKYYKLIKPQYYKHLNLFCILYYNKMQYVLYKDLSNEIKVLPSISHAFRTEKLKNKLFKGIRLQDCGYNTSKLAILTRPIITLALKAFNTNEN